MINHNRWTDPRLRYEPACSGALLLARNEALQIWRPDLYFEQACLAGSPCTWRGSGGACSVAPQPKTASTSQQLPFAPSPPPPPSPTPPLPPRTPHRPCPPTRPRG